MNWGTKLIIAMALFMSFIIALSTKMIFSDKDDLVEKDYYEKGLKYDQDYIRKKNVEQEGAAPMIEQKESDLQVTFAGPVTGKVRFAHSKDHKLDQTITINSDQNGKVSIPLKMSKGYWHLTFEWKSGGKMYMFEKGVFLQ